jgi:hypothetical protein
MHYGVHRTPPSSAPSQVKLVLGALFAFLCLPCSGVGGGMMVAPSEPGDAEAGLGILIVSLVIFGVPAAIFLTLGIRGRRRHTRLQRLAALGAASARLPLNEVALELGVEHNEARRLVLDAVGAGLLVGRLDLEQGVFLSGATTGAVREVAMTCRACGAQSRVVVSANTMSHCQFCGHRLA